MKKHNVLNVNLSLINPFLGLIGSLYSILKGKDACFSFSFCLALIAVYFPLLWDTSANFFQSHYLANYFYSFDFFNLYTSIPVFLMKNFGLDYYYFIFFTTFFVIYTWSKIVYEKSSFIDLNNRYVYIFLFLFFTFNYRDLMDINRSIFSYSILFYYIFLIKNKSTLMFLFFSILSILFHVSAFILVFLYLISFFKMGHRFNFILLVLCIFIGIFLVNFINFFQNSILNIPIYGPALNFYIYGEEFGVQVFSTGTLLKKILNCVIILFVCLSALKSLKINSENKILQFTIYLGCTALIFSGFVTLFERLNLAFNFLILYLFCICINKIHKKIIVFLIFSRSLILYSLVYFPIFFGEHSEVLNNSEVKNQLIIKPFYYPTVLLIDIKNHGYSDNFILKYSIWGK